VENTTMRLSPTGSAVQLAPVVNDRGMAQLKVWVVPSVKLSAVDLARMRGLTLSRLVEELIDDAMTFELAKIARQAIREEQAAEAEDA
jgi:hypothetical protein